MATMSFTWKGSRKDCDSMFISTSPAFEMAICTLLYFYKESDRTTKEVVQLPSTSQKVELVVARDTAAKLLITVYPKEVKID